MHISPHFLAILLDIKGILKLLKPEDLLKSLGPIAWIGVLVMIFAETGLFVGFFLPGDSLLLVSGILSHPTSDGGVPIGLGFPFLLILLILAGILGNTTGYFTGRYLGPRLFKRDDSLIFKKKYLTMTESFYNEHGSMALILGRFIPIIRTFAPILAGAIKLDAKRFLLYNIIGAVLWIGSITTIGYFLTDIVNGIGSAFHINIEKDWVEHNIEYIIIILIIITIIPVIRTYRKESRKHKEANKG